MTQPQQQQEQPGYTHPAPKDIALEPIDPKDVQQAEQKQEQKQGEQKQEQKQ